MGARLLSERDPLGALAGVVMSCALDCGACDACDRADFDAHGDEVARCDCAACERVRARATSDFPRSFEGGFASWARELLGELVSDDQRQE